MKRFLRDPTRLSRFVTKNDLKFIQKNIPTQTFWETKYHHGKEIISYWLKKQPHPENIRNARYYGRGGKGGVLGIKYEQVSKVTNQSDDDWKKFIRPTSQSSGGGGNLTETGQLLSQKAVESYVYSVLGSQARTHWQIVGAGAISLQTQQIFAKNSERHGFARLR